MIVLDSGALVALERDDGLMWARLKAAAMSTTPVVVPSGALGQVWRGGAGRQARLAQALRHCEFAALDEATGKAAGVLCGATATQDVVDASVALAAAHPDVSAVCTSDPDDIRVLLAALGGRASVVAC